MMKCPFCQEEIKDEAIKCRFCGEFLDQAATPTPQKSKWFFRKSSLLISFLVVGPFMLPLIWYHPTYSRNKKIILTIIVAAASYFILLGTWKSFQTLKQYYDMIQQQIM